MKHEKRQHIHNRKRIKFSTQRRSKQLQINSSQHTPKYKKKRQRPNTPHINRRTTSERTRHLNKKKNGKKRVSEPKRNKNFLVVKKGTKQKEIRNKKRKIKNKLRIKA